MSKYTIMNALANGGEVTIPNHSGKGAMRFKSLNRVEKEDGSGHCWNVTGIERWTEKEQTIFVRTED